MNIRTATTHYVDTEGEQYVRVSEDCWLILEDGKYAVVSNPASLETEFSEQV